MAHCLAKVIGQGRLDTSTKTPAFESLGDGDRALITTADLKTQSRRDLVELAKQLGLAGGHSMKKEELITELAKIQRNSRRRTNTASSSPAATTATKAASSKSLKPSTVKSSALKPSTAKPARAATGSASNSSQNNTKRPAAKAAPPPPPKPSPAAQRASKALARRHEQTEREKDLSSAVLVSGQPARNNNRSNTDANKDRIVLIVRDSYWLQATWEVTRSSVQRAAAAMAEHWHTAHPVLRVMRITDGAGANATEQWLRDIPIHGGVNTWYIDVDHPPSRFRVVIGYLADNGRMFVIARSNLVQTPLPGSCDVIEGHWRDIAEDYERIYALSGGSGETVNADLRDMFEERLQRPMSESVIGAGADVSLRRDRDLPFNVDAELIVYGSTVPGASVTLAGEPVKLRADGSFTVRVDLPDRRQVLPVVACSRDGLRQRTTVVAVERNTKVMEPVVTDEDE